MKPEQRKAQELIKKFQFYPSRDNSKESALIHVNEMLEEIKFSRDYIPEYFWKTRDKYWCKVKEEIEKS